MGFGLVKVKLKGRVLVRFRVRARVLGNCTSKFKFDVVLFQIIVTACNNILSLA